jgi:hypothetical protein
MSHSNRREFLLHPALGKIPARRVLQCVFALAPDGPIVHCHVEEVDAVEDGREILYTVNGRPAAPGRERCRVIPPLVREF